MKKISIPPDFDIKPIAAAVIIQAVNESRAGNADATQWLLDDGLLWLDVCGLFYTPAQIKKRLANKNNRKVYRTARKPAQLQPQKF